MIPSVPRDLAQAQTGKADVFLARCGIGRGGLDGGKMVVDLVVDLVVRGDEKNMARRAYFVCWKVLKG
jgi:hypothetical protein